MVIDKGVDPHYKKQEIWVTNTKTKRKTKWEQPTRPLVGDLVRACAFRWPALADNTAEEEKREA